MKRTVPRVLAVAGIAALAAAPFVLGGFPLYVLSMWLIIALSAIGLNICLGLGAMYSFGHGAFMLVGAYGTTVAMTRWGVPLIAALVFAVMLAALVGAVIGLPALRLTGFALAIVTFSFGFMLSNLVKTFDFAGGPQGMVVPDSVVSTLFHNTGLYYLTAVCFLAGLFMFASLSGSKTGRALRTLGENRSSRAASASTWPAPGSPPSYSVPAAGRSPEVCWRRQPGSCHPRHFHPNSRSTCLPRW